VELARKVAATAVAEQRLRLLQASREREGEPEGLGHVKVEIGQDVELELTARNESR
jgi:hypothetical protein